MKPVQNPFQILYVTEVARPAQFVSLFSPLIVGHASSLFEQSNVILRGSQGSGKSTLLNLLKPQIRLAYAQEKIEFPVAAKLREFIGVGINLTRSGATDIGQLATGGSTAKQLVEFPLLFGDFVNYWIARDVLQTIKIMGDNAEVFDRLVNKSRLDKFAEILSKEECFFGFLKGITTFEGIQERIEWRLAQYRAFHQFNIKRLPSSITQSKTAIGEVISRAARSLAASEVVNREVPIYVRIDQYEFIGDYSRQSDQPRLDFRPVINKALSKRDPGVFYKIGVRPYAWPNAPEVYGKGGTLENVRNHITIDIDDLLKRTEHTRSLFPRFARDVFYRRLKYNDHKVAYRDCLERIFGKSKSPEDQARDYVGTRSFGDIIKVEHGWPIKWQKHLQLLFKKNPLEAKLTEAWLRQQESASKNRRVFPSFVRGQPSPWGNKPYWRKERVRQALMQIAGRAAARQRWSGVDSVLDLTKDNILMFVSMCQHIWAAFLRSEREQESGEAEYQGVDHIIDHTIQAVAILTASRFWVTKIQEQPYGSERKQFVDFLGQMFYKQLYEDRAMSYPGANGFSLDYDEYINDNIVHKFLSDCVDYGNLQESDHTTKASNKRRRIKWYLHPMFSPFFKLPETHVKEPLYITTSDIRQWIVKSRTTTIVPEQSELFSS